MRRLAGAAAIISLGNVASRLLGLVREMVIYGLFGATGATSAFGTAARLATLTYDLLISGAISAALVPVFTDYADAPDRRVFARVVCVVLNLLLLALAVVLLVLVAVAPWLVRLLGADPVYFELTVTLTRWALVSVFFLGLAGVLTAALYARRNFKWAAFATAAYNAGIIATAWALTRGAAADPPPESIVALAIGLVVGALLQAGVQLPGLRDLRYQLVFDWRHPGVRTALRLYAPVAAGLVVTTVGILVDTYLAWQTGVESLAVLRAATTLVQFPLGLVASAVSLAALPMLARAAGAERLAAVTPASPPPQDLPPAAQHPTPKSEIQNPKSELPDGYLATLTLAVRLVLLLMLPATAGLVLLREPAVAWLFERGAFDARATAETARAFLFYAPQLPFAALDQLFIVAFYARKDTRTPVLVGVGTVLLYLATAPVLCGCVDLPLAGRPLAGLGRDGLALANTVQNSAHAVVLYALLGRRFPVLWQGELAGYLVRVGVAAAGMGGAVALALPALEGLLEPAPRVVAAGTLGVVVYGVLLVALRVREAELLWAQALTPARCARQAAPAPRERGRG